MAENCSSCATLPISPWPQKMGSPAPSSVTAISTPRTFGTGVSFTCLLAARQRQDAERHEDGPRAAATSRTPTRSRRRSGSLDQQNREDQHRPRPYSTAASAGRRPPRWRYALPEVADRQQIVRRGLTAGALEVVG